MALLQVVIASTRPGRIGGAIGAWAYEHARSQGGFDVELVDLAEVNLPIFDEPQHPRLQQYQHEHTKRWAATVARADAFVFVTPEYNYATPPALVNALDYLLHEWAYAVAGFVSYGGVSGGLRSVQMTKQILTTLKVMPIPEAVTLPFAARSIQDGVFTADDGNRKAADGMLAELARWTGALAPLRRKA
ncbi:MAG: NAD(P)H-dependent oxidoreductase [Acidobacteria bacterium]|nr:NAD(P)H-dependent oxidoreductase [Acidobacteriota bacterium]